jgi:hypothetical protein
VALPWFNHPMLPWTMLAIASASGTTSPECAIIMLSGAGSLSGEYEIQATVHDGKAVFKQDKNYMFYNAKGSSWNVGTKIGNPQITESSIAPTPEELHTWKKGGVTIAAKTQCSGKKLVFWGVVPLS